MVSSKPGAAHCEEARNDINRLPEGQVVPSDSYYTFIVPVGCWNVEIHGHGLPTLTYTGNVHEGETLGLIYPS